MIIPAIRVHNELDSVCSQKPYDSIFSCVLYAITLHPDDPALRKVAEDFFGYVDGNEEIKKGILQFTTSLKYTVIAQTLVTVLKNQIPNSPLSPETLKLFMESAVYIIALHDKSMMETEKLAFIENAIQNNPTNVHLRNSYQKLSGVFSNMFTAKFEIFERDTRKKLIPVLTYLPHINRRKSLDAHLSYLSVTRDDYAKGVLLPDRISPEDERLYMNTWWGFMKAYSKRENWKGPVQDALVNCVYHIIKNFSQRNMLFLKGRFAKICGKDNSTGYWKIFETASHIQAVIDYMDEFLSPTELKEMCDFCAFLLALILWYGGGNIVQEAIKRRLHKLRDKYTDPDLIKKMGIFMLPIDFTFVRNEDGQDKNHDEHNALLKVMKAINHETKVQILGDSMAWARDSFAWLDDDFRLFLQSVHSAAGKERKRGLLDEGGNIVEGTAESKFLFVSRESLREELPIASLSVEAKKRRISVYTLPGGFTWARNSGTHEDVILDSIHIDTVINVISRKHTADGRTKIIIDPYYYQMINLTPEFKRFRKEQGVKTDDIVIIDKRELYLNLANFNVTIDQQGNERLLFNKDKGYTLPRLNLKPGIAIQPDIQIVNISAFNGGIRCITNMFPQTHIKRGNSLLIIPETSVPKDIEKAIIDFFVHKKYLVKNLANVWISILHIRHRFQKSSYEFDESNRMGFITIGYDEIYDPEAACRFIATSIISLCERLGKKMGIHTRFQETDGYVVVPPDTATEDAQESCFIQARSGELITIR